MPSHKIHVFVDRRIFGRSYWRLHRAIDKPYLVFGKSHRIFFHDGWSASEIAKKVYPGDPVAIEAACLHVLLDQLCTSNTNFHNCLKILSENQHHKKVKAHKIKTGKKKQSSTPSFEKQIEKMIKQMLEIQRLARLINS